MVRTWSHSSGTVAISPSSCRPPNPPGSVRSKHRLGIYISLCYRHHRRSHTKFHRSCLYLICLIVIAVCNLWRRVSISLAVSVSLHEWAPWPFFISILPPSNMQRWAWGPLLSWSPKTLLIVLVCASSISTTLQVWPWRGQGFPHIFLDSLSVMSRPS